MTQGGNWYIAHADFDHDGDEDLIGAQGGGYTPALRVLLNDGTGHFSLGSSQSVPMETTSLSVAALALGDLNEDGNVDVVTGTTRGA